MAREGVCNIGIFNGKMPYIDIKEWYPWKSSKDGGNFLLCFKRRRLSRFRDCQIRGT